MTHNSSENHKRTVRIAGVQCAVQKDRKNTIDRVLSFTYRALEKEASLIVYPECFTLPWFLGNDISGYKNYAEPVPGPSTEPFLNISLDNNTVFVCPVFHVEADSYYFSAVVIRKGKILDIYRKIHLATAENWNERAIAVPGKMIVAVELDFCTLGLAMGWDAYFPEAFCALAMRNTDIMVVPTAAAMESGSRWLGLLTTHAVCNNAFVVRVNRCGTESGLAFYGNSFCVDPFGNLIDEPTFHRDSLMICDCQMDDVKLARREFPVLEHRRPDIYRISENPITTGR